jgi:ubiquinone/menaquinone biosynthesis C-methylase UbiE
MEATMSTQTTFDPVKFKTTTRAQWESAAGAWHRWGTFLGEWLGPATERMLDLAGVKAGSRVLDVAAGAGEQTLRAARRVGPSGHVLATDISPRILEFALRTAREAGLSNVETRELDGEAVADLPAAAFDAVISRVGLIYFPDRQKALAGMKRALKPGGRIGAIVYGTPEANAFFSIPISIIRRRAQLPPPLPGQPGPFSLGKDGVLVDALRDAGFRDVVVERVNAPVCLSSAAECVAFERASFGALHQMMSTMTESDRADTWREIEAELQQFERGGGFVGPCELLVAGATQ